MKKIIHSYKNIDFDRYKIYLFVAVIFGIAFIHIFSWIYSNSDSLIGEDIWNTWKEGENIALGINPYERTLEGDLRINDKYPVYFPSSFLLSAFLYKLGFDTFDKFLNIWRPINLFSSIFIAFFLYRIYSLKGYWFVGLLTVVVSCLGNFALFNLKAQNIEFLAIFLLLSSILLIERNTYQSAFLYGLSLSFKHIGILIFPLILSKLNGKNKIDTINNIKNFSIFSLFIPLIISLPFFIDSPKGFITSILFTVTRADRIGAFGISNNDILFFILDFIKIIMFFLILTLSISHFKNKLPFFFSSAFTFIIFNQFYIRSFTQYQYWGLIFTLIAISEILQDKRKLSLKKKNELMQNK